MSETGPEDGPAAEPEFLFVEAPPGAAASQGGTGEMIVFRGPRPQAPKPRSGPSADALRSSETITSAGDFSEVKPGDRVHREFYGLVTALVVTKVDDELIYTGDGGWTFDRRTGWETDSELGIGWRFGVTISRLIRDPSSDDAPPNMDTPAPGGRSPDP